MKAESRNESIFLEIFQKKFSERKICFSQFGTFHNFEMFQIFPQEFEYLREIRLTARGFELPADSATCAIFIFALCLQTFLTLFSRKIFTTEKLFQMFTFSLEENAWSFSCFSSLSNSSLSEERYLAEKVGTFSGRTSHDAITKNQHRAEKRKIWEVWKFSLHIMTRCRHFPFFFHLERMEENRDFISKSFLFKFCSFIWI